MQTRLVVHQFSSPFPKAIMTKNERMKKTTYLNLDEHNLSGTIKIILIDFEFRIYNSSVILHKGLKDK